MPPKAAKKTPGVGGLTSVPLTGQLSTIEEGSTPAGLSPSGRTGTVVSAALLAGTPLTGVSPSATPPASGRMNGVIPPRSPDSKRGQSIDMGKGKSPRSNTSLAPTNLGGPLTTSTSPRSGLSSIGTKSLIAPPHAVAFDPSPPSPTSMSGLDWQNGPPRGSSSNLNIITSKDPTAAISNLRGSGPNNDGWRVHCVARIHAVEPPAAGVLATDIPGSTNTGWAKVMCDTNQIRLTGLSDGRSTSVALAATYDAATTTEQLFDREIRPLCRATVQGYSTSILGFGPHGSGKQYTFHGSTPPVASPMDDEEAGLMGMPELNGGASQQAALGGLISMTVRELHSLLKARAASTSGDDRGSRRDLNRDAWSLSMRYVEIHNDTIRDMLVPNGGQLGFDDRPWSASSVHSNAPTDLADDEAKAEAEKKKLQVELTEDGINVPGATCVDIRAIPDFDTAYGNGLTLRSGERTQSERTTGWLCIDVEQNMGVGGGGASRSSSAAAPQILRSRIVFVTLPSTNRLADNPHQLRMREGARTNRELLTFGRLLRRLSDQTQAAPTSTNVTKSGSTGTMNAGASGEAPISYSDSKTTQLMEDIFGGNSITLNIMTMSSYEPAEVARVTVGYVQRMGRINNQPVVGDARSTALLRRLRSTIMRLRVDLSAAQAAGLASGGAAGIKPLNLNGDDDFGGPDHVGAGVMTLPPNGDANTSTNGNSNSVDKQRELALEAKWLEAKAAVIAGDTERTALVAERDDLVRKLAALRDQFASIAEGKTSLASELIQSEEQRLAASKQLIDIQLEMADMKDQYTNDKYELEAKLLAIEHAELAQQVDRTKHADKIAILTKQLEDMMQVPDDHRLHSIVILFNNCMFGCIGWNRKRKI
jgi:hypothetical protein